MITLSGDSGSEAQKKGLQAGILKILQGRQGVLLNFLLLISSVKIPNLKGLARTSSLYQEAAQGS